MSAQALFEDAIVLVELTELAARVPPGAREYWALDCAKRAIGDDNWMLRRQRERLRGWWRIGQQQLERRLSDEPEPPQDDLRQLFEAAQASVPEIIEELPAADVGRDGVARVRAVAAVQSLVHALRCVDGHPEHETAARLAQGAFADPREEAGNQARRLLMRTKLIPTGAELLVRLDYAESLGALPRDPEQRAWLDAQREHLMNEDEECRLAVVFRHLDRVFLAELASAGLT
jgi:hypothetical protein